MRTKSIAHTNPREVRLSSGTAALGFSHYLLDPLILLVMNIDGGDLDEFIEGQDRRDRDDRKLPHESREKAERHDHAPERDTVADHAELCVTAGGEDAAYGRSVDGTSHDVVDTHDHHPDKIMG